MNRIIKLRAWNLLTKEWSKLETLELHQEPVLELSDIENVVIWSQFTGLLDKNGKEIFEGDLLQKTDGDDYDRHTSYEVFYHGNDSADNHIGFQMNRIHFYGTYGGGTIRYALLPKYVSKMEVIGNIFENPELLN